MEKLSYFSINLKPSFGCNLSNYRCAGSSSGYLKVHWSRHLPLTPRAENFWADHPQTFEGHHPIASLTGDPSGEMKEVNQFNYWVMLFTTKIEKL